MSRPLFSWRHAIMESDLPPTTRHVLLTLSCHMSDAGDSCFPTVDRLAEETGLSRRAICTHIANAKDAGWLKVDVHGFGGQKWRRHEYMVSLPKGWELGSPRFKSKVVNEVPEGGERGSEGGEPDDRKVVNEVPISTSVNSTGNSTTNSTGEGCASAHPPARVSGSNPEPNRPKPKPPKNPPKANSGKRLVPKDWWPPEHVLADLMQRFPVVAFEDEIERFRDYSRANDKRFKDFDAAFRNWIRKAAEFAQRDGKTPSGGGARRYLD